MSILTTAFHLCSCFFVSSTAVVPLNCRHCVLKQDLMRSASLNPLSGEQCCSLAEASAQLQQHSTIPMTRSCLWSWSCIPVDAESIWAQHFLAQGLLWGVTDVQQPLQLRCSTAIHFLESRGKTFWNMGVRTNPCRSPATKL